MTTTLTRAADGRARAAVAAALTAVVIAAVMAALMGVLTGCSTRTALGDPGDTAATVTTGTSSDSSRAPSVTPWVRVMLTMDDHGVSATFTDTLAARQLAQMLPLTVELSDAWGQAKAGRLPHPVSVEGVPRTMKPIAGGIYYWPDTATLAVYYDDLGQSVPPPGLVQLGVLDTDVDQIADVGRHTTVRLNWVTQAPS